MEAHMAKVEVCRCGQGFVVTTAGDCEVCDALIAKPAPRKWGRRCEVGVTGPSLLFLL